MKKELLQKLNAAQDELSGIVDTPDGEDPQPLSDEQRTRCNELEASCADLESQIDALDADEELRKKAAARRERLAVTSAGRASSPAVPRQSTAIGDDDEALSRERKRLDARHAGRLRSFKGAQAKLDAYRSGMFLLAIAGGGELGMTGKAIDYCRTHGLAMGTGDNNLGGFLVPTEFETAVIDLREEYGRFRQNAKIVPMASDTMSVPRRASGLTAYYLTDNREITASDKGWSQVMLVAKKLAVLSKYSSELSEDSVIDLADNLADEIAYTFALEEDQAGFLGDGTSTYGGISGLITECTTATATTVDSDTGNTTFGTLDLADFHSMVGTLPEYAAARAKWYISRAGFAASMARLMEAAGGNTAEMIAGATPMSFLGAPVIISQVMNSTLSDNASAAGACYFGDLQLAATMGDRRGIAMSTSVDRYFEFDQLAIRGTQRYDINVHDVGDTSNAGAMVMLTFAAS